MDGSASKTHDCYKYYDLKSEGRSFFTCDGCKMDGFGAKYVCKLCDNTLHKVCRYPKTPITHDYFENSSSFTFNEDNLKGKCCVACGKDIRGFNYHCSAKNLTLHPVCYKLGKKIYFDDKIFNLRKKLVSNCAECDKIYANAQWAYVSSCNTNTIHVHCLTERVHEFKMKHGDIHSSSATTNEVETPDFDLSSLLESKIKSGNGSTTPEQVFVEFLADDVDPNPPKKEEAESTKPGILGRISKFFKSVYDKVISGITLTYEKVWNAAVSFYLKITSWWCNKIVDFFQGITDLSEAVHPYLKEAGCITNLSEAVFTYPKGAFSPEILLHTLAKVFNLNFTLEQIQKILALFQMAQNI